MLVGRRSVSVGLSVGLLVTAVGMTPIQAASATPLPDPPPRPVMPAEVRQLQPNGLSGLAPGNRVREITEQQRQAWESTGTRVVQSKVGLLVLEQLDQRGEPVRIAMFDTATESGIEVVGLAFGYAAEIEDEVAGPPSTGISFGPQPVSAHRNGTNHYHNLQWPFSSSTYVYNYANGDSFLHVGANDVGWMQYIASGWAGALATSVGFPFVGFVGGVAVYGGINNFKNPDGSIDMFGPNSTINSRYGNSYYYGALGGWYYHHP